MSKCKYVTQAVCVYAFVRVCVKLKTISELCRQLGGNGVDVVGKFCEKCFKFCKSDICS